MVGPWIKINSRISVSTNISPTISNSLRFDLSAGLVVSLVALPLCLGIALASGAPLLAGVIAGIVGGTVVALISGSEISVSGPAAGLAVIVAAAIQTMGGFEMFLPAVIVGGVIQIILGLLKLGVIGDYVPSAVIKGMLAAIGTVIVLKQIPHALGRDKDYEGDFGFMEGQENTLTDIVAAINSFSGAAVLITLVCLAVLLLWERPAIRRMPLLRLIPGPLLAVAIGISMNQLFRVLVPGFELSDPEHMVRLPVPASILGFFQQFTFPDLHAFQNQQVYIVGATIAIVASLESLLSLEASDKLDPYRRISPTNRELLAQGSGNVVSGLLGGLPITAVVVRTSANIYAGGRTRMSALVHGALLLAMAMLFPKLLNLTPLACLAAILLVIGYKLAKIDLFVQMWKAGYAQFLPFIVTVIAIVFTDLLKGVIIGFAVGLFFVIRANRHHAITLISQDNYYLLRFNKDATFVNKSEVKEALRSIPANATVILDGTKALYIDRDIREVVDEFRQSCYFQGIKLEFKNFGTHGNAAPEALVSTSH